MDENVTVEETTEVIEPETTTEETTGAEASDEDTTSEETTEIPAEAEEVEAEKPKRTSRASERIRELVAQKKELEAQLKRRAPLDGVDETGIDPERFAQSIEIRSSQATAETLEYYKAENEFPLVKDNTMVRSRAAVLVDDGYTPIQAAEIATLEWNESIGNSAAESAKRKNANAKMRQNTQIPSAGKSIKTSDSSFSRAEIDRMSPQDYVKNASAIQAQLEKYGPESFE